MRDFDDMMWRVMTVAAVGALFSIAYELHLIAVHMGIPNA